MKELKYAVMFTLTSMVLFGGVYPLVVWAIGRSAFGEQSNGSLIVRDDGTVIGSRLIAQAFVDPKYFHPRPSGVDYNAASTGGTNYAPSNPDHLKAVKERVDQEVSANGVTASQLPSEMVTASGAGLDPHISPAAAEIQVARVARARGVGADAIRDVVRAHLEAPFLGVLGRPRVNVLELNLALDAALRKVR